MYVVVDNEFNRANYPELIGRRVKEPPAYAQVQKTDMYVQDVPEGYIFVTITGISKYIKLSACDRVLSMATWDVEYLDPKEIVAWTGQLYVEKKYIRGQ